jgi:hypothetical protein
MPDPWGSLIIFAVGSRARTQNNNNNNNSLTVADLFMNIILELNERTT